MKYNIENNIDFFSELYKSLDTIENQEKTEEDDNYCLISGDLLTDRFVTMKCGHKFNYAPLFNDIMHHKLKFNSLESSNKLKCDEIRCPYCRHKQTEVLPYYEDMSFEKMNGVNFYSPELPEIKNYCNYNYHPCEFKKENPYFDIMLEESFTNKKFVKCYYNGNALNAYNDTKCYCYKHTKTMVSKYKLEIYNKIKEDAQKVKENTRKAKEELKLKKEADKQLKEQVKNQQKQEKLEKKGHASKKVKKVVNLEDENVVISPDITIETEIVPIYLNKCSVILKSGVNKDKQCMCNIFQDELCKRHYSKSTAI